MVEFRSLKTDAEEQPYQDWLKSHLADGWVISLNKGRTGKHSVHRPHCVTISYDKEETGRPERSGKLCFDNREELTAWQNDNPEYADLNRCGRCDE